MIFTVQNGVVGPKGIPRDVLKKWGEVAEITMKNANVIDAITKLEYIAESGSGEDFEKDVVGELMRLRELLHVK
jgi:tripartite-type tricarboxylate transporter receptor subunit TctC